MLHRYILPVLLVTALSISGCAGSQGKYIRDGKEYGSTSGSFRGRWWNYYERGRSFSDGKFYTEAIADFKKAIEGRDEDKWRARTYGMHFMDYFPHRELGVAYFQRKNYDMAIDELEYSIQSAPSAKAHYFLNKARAEKLRQEGRDSSAPEIFLEGSTDKTVTNNFTQSIKGVAEDDTYVASIQVGDRHVPMELAEAQRVFTVEVPLDVGDNIIQIIATDLAGKSTTQELEILCDRTGPIVEILQVRAEGKDKVVKGVVSDPARLKSLVINGKPWKITGNSLAYNFKFSVPKEGVTIIATDIAGNVTRATLTANENVEDPLMNPRLAGLEPSNVFDRDSMVISDAHIPMLASTKKVPADTDPPFFKLTDLGTNQETYENYVLFEGMVVDFSPIHSVSVNGEPISHNNGKKIYFSQLIKLDEGNNEFLIVAIDTHGNRSEKHLKINRKVQNIRQIGSRMSVAVLPFDHTGETSSIGELIHDQLIDSLLDQKRFNLVERKKIEAVLRELKLSSTDLVDPDKAVNLGKIVAANTMLTGTVIEAPDSVEIIGRLIDTETATILASNDIFGEDKSFSSLDNLLDILAFKFKRDFPLLEGILIEVREGEVVIDIGSEHQAKPNLHFICYRKGLEIKHPVTGKILGAEPEILGDLRLEEVFENFSKASLKKHKGEVRIYDQVIAK